MSSSSYVIISDVHRRASAVAEVLRRQVRQIDALIFCGDGLSALNRLDESVDTNVNIFAVWGNWDATARRLIYSSGFVEDVPEERIICLDGKRILLMHGHTRGVKHSLVAAIAEARRADADALIFGHTHETVCFLDEGEKGEKTLWVFNPGALEDGNFGALEIRGGVMLFSHGKI